MLHRPELANSASTDWAERSEFWRDFAGSMVGKRKRRERPSAPLILCGHGVSLRVEQSALVIRDGFTHYPQQQGLHRYFPGDRSIPTRIMLLDGSGTISFAVLDWLGKQGVALARVKASGDVSVVASGNGYAFLTSEALSERKRGAFETALSGQPTIHVIMGFWIAVAALCTSIFLHERISKYDELDEEPSWRSRISGVGLIFCLFGLANLKPTAHSQPNALIASTTVVKNNSADSAVANERPVEPNPLESGGIHNISIGALTKGDVQIEGASCWATDSDGNQVFASDGTGLIKINGGIVRLEEDGNEIGSDTLHSKDRNIWVTFKHRQGKTEFFEEGRADPATMTISVSGMSTRLAVTKSCGA